VTLRYDAGISPFFPSNNTKSNNSLGGDGYIDFATATKWQPLIPGVDYNPSDLCGITGDELGEFLLAPAARSRIVCRHSFPSCVFAYGTHQAMTWFAFPATRLKFLASFVET
jgi:hypothetical protein